MTESRTAQPPSPGPEHRLLGVFVGTWHTEGEIRAGVSGPVARFHATDSYEWLPGGFFLVHRWEAHMPEGVSQGIEIIGYDPGRRTYPMHTFDNQGNTDVLEASVNGNTWTFTGKTLRFTGSFLDDGNTIAGMWEQRSEDSPHWQQWMDVRLTKPRFRETKTGIHDT